uniref:Uncharacterized protein n=1 Tax=Anguilla anguilla TaxID=7936 RepID=A0A0E9Y1U2_ANGAN
MQPENVSGDLFIVKNAKIVLCVHHLNRNSCFIINMKVVFYCFFGIKRNLPFTFEVHVVDEIHYC